MLFDFILKQTKLNLDENVLTVRGRQIPLVTIRNHRARRYLLKLRPDGSARLTIPRRGSIIEGDGLLKKIRIGLHSNWRSSQHIQSNRSNGSLEPKFSFVVNWFASNQMLTDQFVSAPNG